MHDLNFSVDGEKHQPSEKLQWQFLTSLTWLNQTELEIKHILTQELQNNFLNCLRL